MQIIWKQLYNYEFSYMNNLSAIKRLHFILSYNNNILRANILMKFPIILNNWILILYIANVFNEFKIILNISYKSTWPIDRTLTGSTTLDQSEPGSNDNERMIHITQRSRSGATSMNAGHPFWGYITPLKGMESAYSKLFQ